MIGGQQWSVVCENRPVLVESEPKTFGTKLCDADQADYLF